MVVSKISRTKLIQFIISGSLLFYAISGINSLLNYALYPVLSRLLPVSDYGEAQFLLSAFNQLSIAFVVLNILAIILSALTKDKATQDSRIASLNVVASTIAVIVTIIGIAVLYAFSGSLGIGSNLSIILLGVSLLLNVPFTIFLGQLQGNGKFTASASVSFVATFAKFGFSILFAGIGMGVNGVIGGVVLGMLVSIVLSIFFIKGFGHETYRSPFKQHLSAISFVKTQAILGFVSVGLITILSSIDSVVSRILLDGTNAGLYSTVATLSKIILAATAPLLWLALPHAVQSNTKAVWQYIGITSIIGFVSVAIFSSNPTYIITTLLSVDPGVYADLVPIASLSMAVYAVALIATAVLLCCKQFSGLVITYGCLAVAALVLLAISLTLSTLTMRDVVIGQLVLGLAVAVPSIISLKSWSVRANK